MAQIIDQFGKPIERTVLDEPQTARVGWLNREFAEHPARGLTPVRLARILQDAEQGDIIAQHDLYLDMEEKDGHIFAEMSKRKRAILTVPWDIAPPRNASKAEEDDAAYIRERLQDMADFEDVLIDTLDAIGHGFCCQEIEWQRLGGDWLPKAITHRAQSWFQIDRHDRNTLRLRDNTLDGQDLLPFGWIVHTHKAKSGYLARGGLHRILAWPFLFKNYSVRDLAEFLEIYGLPLRLGKYPAGATAEEKATLLRAVTQIGHAAAGIIPEGMAIDFEAASNGAHDPFQAQTDWCERTQSKVILGGTLTSQADGKTSTNALGNVHNEVRHDLLASDARQLAGTLTRQLVYPLLALNRGMAAPQRCPRFVFDTREIEDLALLADALPKLSAVMPIPVSWAQERGGIPAPKDGEAILAAPAAATVPPTTEPAKPAGKPAALKAQPGAADPVDTADRLVPGLATTADPAVAGWVDLIEAELAACKSLAEFRDRLLGLYGHLPHEDLAKVMGQAFEVADLRGRFEVKHGA